MNSQINISNSNNKNKSNADCTIDSKTSCCFSGHRAVSNGDKAIISRNLPPLLERLYLESGIRTFISGGALGFDTIAANEVIKLKNKYSDARLVLALPCRNQSERWNSSQKMQYDSILNSADEILYVSENYTPHCMHKRNRFMVDSSSTVVVYIQNASSGTGYTTKYALDNERKVINILTDI